MPEEPSGFEFNPDKADEAEVLLRSAANSAEEAALLTGSALSAVHEASHPFGTSREATALADKWDSEAGKREGEARAVSSDATELADALRDSSRDYQRRDLDAMDTFNNILPD